MTIISDISFSGVFLLTSQLTFGFFFSFYYIRKKFLSFSVSFAVGQSLSSLCYLLFSFIFGMNKAHTFLNAFCLFIASFFLSKEGRKIKRNATNSDKLTNTTILEISACFTVAYFLVSNYYFKEKNAVNYQITILMSEEITMIKSFLYGVNSNTCFKKEIVHPFCYKCFAKTQYLQSYSSAILVSSGFSLKYAIIIPSTISIALSFYSFLLFAKTVLCEREKHLSYAALFLVFNCGGFGFMQYFVFSKRTAPFTDYVYSTGDNATKWLHPIILYLLGNRSSQNAFCLAITIMHCLFEQNLMEKKQYRTFKFIGLILGLLPCYQFECFFGCILFIVIYLIVKAIKEKAFNMKNEAIGILLGAAMTGVYPLILLKPFSASTNTMSKMIKLGNPVEDLWKNWKLLSFFILCFNNLGSFFITSLISFISLDQAQVIFYIVSAISFVIINFIEFFGSYIRISYSLMPTWAAFQSVFIVMFLHDLMTFNFKIFKKKDELNDEDPCSENEKGAIAGLALMLYITMTLSSIVGIFYNMGHDVPLWNDREEVLAEYIAHTTPKDSVFITPEFLVNTKHYSKFLNWIIQSQNNQFLNPALLSGRVNLRSNVFLLYFHRFNWQIYDDEMKILNETNDTPSNISFAKYLITFDSKSNMIKQARISNSSSWNIKSAYEKYKLFEHC